MPYSSNHKVTKRLLAGRCIGSPSKRPSIVLSLSFTQDDKLPVLNFHPNDDTFGANSEIKQNCKKAQGRNLCIH